MNLVEIVCKMIDLADMLLCIVCKMIDVVYKVKRLFAR